MFVSKVRIQFDWDPPKARSNLAKHGVAFRGAAVVFDDAFATTVRDDDHSNGDERWVTIGMDSATRLVVVVHTWEEDARGRIYVRIVSARRPTKREAHDYEGGRWR